MSSDERLVLADALLAEGDLRGELIIVQSELARGGYTRERGITLRRRERELLSSHQEWGDELTIDVATYVDHEDEIWARRPNLRWVRFRGLSYDSSITDLGDASLEWPKIRPRLERALASGRVRYFAANDASVVWETGDADTQVLRSGPLAHAIAEWLVSEPAILSRLRGVGLYDVEPTTLDLLTGSDAASAIEELELIGPSWVPETPKMQPRRLRIANVGPTGPLLASPFAARLTELDTDEIDPVLESSVPRRLRSLTVSSVFYRRTLNDIADAPALATLENLAVLGNHGEQLELELEPFYRPRHLEALRTLRLGTGVTPGRARRLLRSPLAERLELIDLRQSSAVYGPHHRFELKQLWDGVLLV